MMKRGSRPVMIPNCIKVTQQIVGDEAMLPPPRAKEAANVERTTLRLARRIRLRNVANGASKPILCPLRPCGTMRAVTHCWIHLVDGANYVHAPRLMPSKGFAL